MLKKDIIHFRENIIHYIYYFELMNEELNIKNAFELYHYDKNTIYTLELIQKNYEKYKKIIHLFIKKEWKWERITPLNRAVLIYGVFEIMFNDFALIIDIMIKYCHKFIPDDSYKFINSVLDKIGKFYEKNKNSKKKIEKK